MTDPPQLTTATLLTAGCLLLLLSQGCRAADDRNATTNSPYHDYKGKAVRFGGGAGAKMLWVHSGTKWCGAGNIATSFNDLGSAFETDKCCRQHDYCSVYVRPNEEKYNFQNTFLYTISHCECDNTFFNCLHASKDAQAKSVLYYFFYSLRMPCISLTPKPACVRRTWWDKLVGGCSQSEVRESAELMRLPQVYASQEAHTPPPLKFRTSRR